MSEKIPSEEANPGAVLHVENGSRIPIGYADTPVEIHVNNFVHKSLSNFACNVAVGCGLGCRFCFVPKTSTIKQKNLLAVYGVRDPDEQWGEYVLLRPWNEQRFLKSLMAAENIPRAQLKPDGHRAVMFSSTTDPYQVFRHPDAYTRSDLDQCVRFTIRRSLELIRDRPTLNVRILSRSPLSASLRVTAYTRRFREDGRGAFDKADFAKRFLIHRSHTRSGSSIGM